MRAVASQDFTWYSGVEEMSCLSGFAYDLPDEHFDAWRAAGLVTKAPPVGWSIWLGMADLAVIEDDSGRLALSLPPAITPYFERRGAVVEMAKWLSVSAGLGEREAKAIALAAWAKHLTSGA